MTEMTPEVTLADFEPQVRIAANTLCSIGDNKAPEVTAEDALAGLEAIPHLHRTEIIRDAIKTLEQCTQAKQLGNKLFDQFKNL